MAAPIVGIDLGGTQIRAVLATPDGTILARVAAPTAPHEGQNAVVERIANAARQVIRQAGGQPPRGVGVGSAGAVDPASGVVLSAPNLHWSQVPLRALLQDELGLPVVVGNDANAAALAEHRFGAGRGTTDLIYLTISTGIGAGIISGGRLLLGQRGLAGEVGHTTINPDGPACPCGNRGCLEAVASGPALGAAAVARMAAGEPSRILALAQGDPRQVTAQVVGRAAAGGDALALDLVERTGQAIGIGLVNLIHILAPHVILIGGGVAQIGAPLFAAIRATVSERAMACFRQGLRIEPAALGSDVGVLGAIALFLSYEHH